MGSNLIRVVLADPSEMVLNVLGSIIASATDLCLVGRARDAITAIALVKELQPDIALVDVSEPCSWGEEVAREIAVCSPMTNVIALGKTYDRDDVMTIFGAGAVGFILKSEPVDRLLTAIVRVSRGEIVLSTEVAHGVIEGLLGQRRDIQHHENAVARRRAQIEKILVTPKMLEIFGQSILHLGSQRHIGLEALARFPASARRPTERWFSLAREVGLGKELELAAASRALAHLAEIPGDQFVAINLSPKVAMTKAMSRLFKDVDLSRVVIEITEHAAIENYDALSRAFAAFRSNGGRIAVDDTGAGYSSLKHLLKIRPDIVKIDTTLVRSIETSSSQQRLVSGILNFANDTGSIVIAEGIETEPERMTLMDLDVPYGQGYLLARPVSLQRPS